MTEGLSNIDVQNTVGIKSAREQSDMLEQLQPVFVQQTTFVELFRLEETVLQARRDNPQTVIPMIDIFQGIPESRLGGHV
nr:hypothetical protein [Candidatus Levybacteria bacterium]